VVRVPVRLVSWDEIVEWSRGLSETIKKSGWLPDVVVAVSRGGFVPARLICDFLDISDLLSIQSQHWVEAAKAAEKAILKYPYHLDLSDKNVLIVDDIVDTGDTLALAKEFIEKEWKPKSVRTATLQWISSVAKFKPDYYYIEVKEWTWFQYPWTRLEDVTQFIKRILKEDERAKGKFISLNELETLFKEWYGIDRRELGFYWDLALERLKEKEIIIEENGMIKLIKN
jgi:hypoxanthine phosphoribosyltransferase